MKIIICQYIVSLAVDLRLCKPGCRGGMNSPKCHVFETFEVTPVAHAEQVLLALQRLRPTMVMFSGNFEHKLWSKDIAYGHTVTVYNSITIHDLYNCKTPFNKKQKIMLQVP